jgi:glutaredoxin 3
MSSTPPPTSSSAAAAMEKAQGIIADHGVVVFSKSYCPYCRSAKALLGQFGANYFLIELDQVPDGPAIQDALEQITNQSTVPNIFIKQTHIGGNSDLQARRADLPGLLKEAGAI